MKPSTKTAQKEADIRETIGKLTFSLISEREMIEEGKLSADEIIMMNNAVASIIRRFAQLEPKNRFFFHYKWKHEVNGREYGFSYLSHYICQLFTELASKRYEPKSKKDMSYVMKLAHSIKKESGKDLSTAMTKAYVKVERSGKLRTDSMEKECRIISEACLLGQWNSIMPFYPCLNKSLAGKDDNARPKAKAITLIADILGPLCTMIGYK